MSITDTDITKMIADRQAERRIELAKRAEIDLAELNLRNARARMNRLTNSRSISAQRIVISNYAGKLEQLRNIGHEEALDKLRELTDEQLKGRYVSAANYSYECTMGDYSMGSITSAQRQLDDVKQILAERNISTESIAR